jgi:hypothetical protein
MSRKLQLTIPYSRKQQLDLRTDLKRNRSGSLAPKQPDKLEGPSAMTLTDRKLYVLNMAGIL